MIKSEKLGKLDDYVYDIHLDGTVVNALGNNVLSNTDGFNFQLPKSYRYTKENPYIGKGLGRNVTEGKKYVGVFADIAEKLCRTFYKYSKIRLRILLLAVYLHIHFILGKVNDH